MPLPYKPPVTLNIFKILRVVIIAVIAIWALFFVKSTFFTVATDEEAVITRLGAYNRTVGPGLHAKWPMGMEELYLVPIKRQMKLEFGFRSEKGQESEARAGGSLRMRTRYS